MKPAVPDIKIPEAFQTERLLLRAPRRGDGKEMNAAILETFDDLRLWMPWAQKKETVEQTEENTRNAIRFFRQRTELRFHMYLRDTGALMGGCGLHHFDWSTPCMEIGYWCRKSYWGNGYVTEAVRGLTALAFATLGASRVEIHCDARNERSAHVAERAGYQLEGCLRRNSRAPDGSLRDTLVFGMTVDDYAGLREIITKGITGLPCLA